MSINPLSSGQGDSSAKQQELNVPFDMGQNGCWITSALSSCRSRCELRSYGGAERERNGGMVAPVQVPVSPELNCGVFTASLQVSLLQVAAVGELTMVLACIGMSRMKHVHDPT